MKTTRRKFFQVIAGGLGYIALAAVIPYRPAFPEPVVKEKEKHPKDVICKDFQPQITIQEYKPGEPVKYQDLRVNPECSMCMFEDRCSCRGAQFTAKTGTLVPEIWSEKLQKKWYENSKFGKL